MLQVAIQRASINRRRGEPLELVLAAAAVAGAAAAGATAASAAGAATGAVLLRVPEDALGPVDAVAPEAARLRMVERAQAVRALGMEAAQRRHRAVGDRLVVADRHHVGSCGNTTERWQIEQIV